MDWILMIIWSIIKNVKIRRKNKPQITRLKGKKKDLGIIIQ